jgi:hypothetical protein
MTITVTAWSATLTSLKTGHLKPVKCGQNQSALTTHTEYALIQPRRRTTVAKARILLSGRHKLARQRLVFLWLLQRIMGYPATDTQMAAGRPL